MGVNVIWSSDSPENESFDIYWLKKIFFFKKISFLTGRLTSALQDQLVTFLKRTLCFVDFPKKDTSNPAAESISTGPGCVCIPVFDFAGGWLGV